MNLQAEKGAVSTVGNQHHLCREQITAFHCIGELMETPSISNEPRETENFKDVKVMIVDDSKTIRRTAELLLTKAGCEVITAVDGFEALATVARHHPDIIFIDIMMPKLDGYQTCSLIKNNKSYRKIPIVMLSSKDGLFDRAKSRISGSDDYLTKPFTREELLGVIRTQVIAHRS